MDHSDEIAPVDGRCPGCDRWVCDGRDGDLMPDPVLAALDFLVQASRVSPVLRAQVQIVEDEIRYLRSRVADEEEAS